MDSRALVAGGIAAVILAAGAVVAAVVLTHDDRKAAAGHGSPTASPDLSPTPSTLERVHSRQLTALRQGQRVWAVFVGVGDDARDPRVSRAKLALADIGYLPSGEGDVGCDGGAATALGVRSTAYVVDVDFPRRADAVDFRDAFVAATRPATIVVARISVGCLD